MAITITPSSTNDITLPNVCVSAKIEIIEGAETLTDPFLIHDAWQAVSTVYESAIRQDVITDLHEPGYTVIRPIPYEMERTDDNEFVACVADVNIAISGADKQDAYQSLVAEILDTFDTLTQDEEHLGADAAAQLALLKTYIVKA